MTEPEKPPAPDPWAAATHEGNEREQLQRWAKTSLLEKVRWLEQAQRLANALQKSRATARPITPGPSAK